MEASRRPIKAPDGGGIINALAGVGLDLRELGGQFWGHDRRFHDLEAPERAIGQR